MEELQQYYYYELKNLLCQLGYDMKKFPTLHEFHRQILKKYFYGKNTTLLACHLQIKRIEQNLSTNTKLSSQLSHRVC